MKDEQFLGLVKDEKLMLLVPEVRSGHIVKLTEMPIQAAINPEVQEISLRKHEGKAIMVIGKGSDDWIYSAELIDLAGPIVSTLVQKVFKKDK
ncbi:MAG: hypothetical protein MUO26_13300 [Methanotrichaceae archaeon]|nr:hypothetical protein [Methanotrichaceae archaeon]